MEAEVVPDSLEGFPLEMEWKKKWRAVRMIRTVSMTISAMPITIISIGASELGNSHIPYTFLCIYTFRIFKSVATTEAILGKKNTRFVKTLGLQPRSA
jgi:hypothetical protein